MKLLENLVKIHAPSGEEFRMKKFILAYVKKESIHWKTRPQIIEGSEFQDSLILVFGNPRTAIFAHMDSIGFTVRYQNQLIPIGSPEVKTGYRLVGEDKLGPIDCTLQVDEEHRVFYDFPRGIMRGTSLVYEPNFRLSKEFVQSPYLDNRLGVYSALKVAETLQDGVIVFSCFEEHGGGSIPVLIKYLYENYKVNQALISDITWVTDGIEHGKGVVISMRDRNIPRKSFIDQVIALADASELDYQLEVEGDGSSDAREIHLSPYPVDWCFIGAPEDNVHSPDEKVHLKDIESMIDMYGYLMNKL